MPFRPRERPEIPRDSLEWEVEPRDARPGAGHVTVTGLVQKTGNGAMFDGDRRDAG
jgi:hypothetical protein